MPNLMSTAQRLLQAGQVRANRELAKTEKAPHEVGALRGLVRNLCAELAAFEPEDGSVEIEFNGEQLHVHIQSEQIQVNGRDISRLLSRSDVMAIICLAEEVQRQQMIDQGNEARELMRAAA